MKIFGRVGGGAAFASEFILCMLEGKSLDEEDRSDEIGSKRMENPLMLDCGLRATDLGGTVDMPDGEVSA